MIHYFNRKQLVKAGLLVLITAFSKTATAQPPYPPLVPVSYIRTYDAVAPESDGNMLLTRPVKDVKVTTQYFDGLGRPIQTVMKQASMETGGTPTDMVSPVEYDDLGREQNKYLPFAANGANGNTSISDGLFKRNPFQQQTSFMTEQYGLQGETFFFGKTNFETSPLNRVEKTMPPGNSWVGNGTGIGVSMKYWNNTSVDDVKVWKVENVAGAFGNYSINTAVTGGVYDPGKLYKSITVDEHEKQVIEFKDTEGKVLLKKVQLTATADDGPGKNYDNWLCTYYIYDKLNNLRCVIQPEGVKWLDVNGWALPPSGGVGGGSIVDEQCFRYEYDERNRMIMKKVPGAEPVYMVYDRWDRVILTQDGNQRLTNTWIFTKYDEQNRPILTGLHSDATNTTLAAMIAHMNASTGWATRYESINTSLTYGYTTTQTYPSVSSPTILTATHYDDYTGLPGGLSSSFLNTWNVYLTPAGNSWPYPQTPQQSMATKGMVTWGQVRVLDPSSGSGPMLTTVMIYDDKGRAIQMQSTNITGGTDVATTQYTWAGQPLVMIQKQQKSGGSTAQEHIVVTKMEYDDLGRVKQVSKAVNSTIGGVAVNKPEQLIVENKYDKLGQLKEKQLGGGSGTPLWGAGGLLNYDYNIRGWMLGMNRDYLTGTGQSGTAKFGFELAYDKQSSVNGRPFIATQYNGNITGMLWKSDGDDVKRKYDFRYDAANRLLKGQFEQDDAINSWNNTTMNYAMQMGDGNDPYSAYDANGNIKGMTQYGWKLGGNMNLPIDNLRYTYLPGSNKLKSVTDFNNDPVTRLGDFKTNATHPQEATKTGLTIFSTQPQFDAITDYSYDVNGNLVLDNNKAISSITYNHLNLPTVITVAGKGTISYTYDAGGNKLKKQTTDISTAGKTITSTTSYIGGMVYESRTTVPADPDAPDYAEKLQFMGQEEGRIRYREATPILAAGFEYDYMIKDHLDNVRMVLTEEVKQDVYPAATLEEVTYNGGTAISKEDDFYTITPANVVYKSAANGIPDYQNNNGNPPYNNNPYSNYTANSNRVYKLNATTNTNSNKTGLGVVLKVMAGDNVNIFGKSYHRKPAGGSYGGPTNTIILTELINAFAGSGIVSGHGVTGTQITGQSGFPTTVEGLTGNQPAQSGDRPKAAINWIVFDEQFKYVTGGFDMVDSDVSGDGVLKNHNLSTIPAIPIPKNGYIYVYCSNESKYDVFFDNLQVIHNRGPVLEETHYYPFGLVQAGISSKALSFGDPKNKEKTFQGQRFDDDLGLNWVQFKWRNHDPQIGRFIELDPLSEKYVYNSTYAFSENKVIAHGELEGLESILKTSGPIMARLEAMFSGVAELARERTSAEKEQGDRTIASINKWFEDPVNVIMIAAAPVQISNANIQGSSNSTSRNVIKKEIQAVINNEIAATEAAVVTSSEVNLGVRAKEIHGALPAATQRRTTTAVAAATTKEGESVILVASSENVLRPAQRAALKPGEIAVTGKGHAEVTVLNYAEANWMKVTQIGASRPICAGCAAAISNSGVQAASALKTVGTVISLITQ